VPANGLICRIFFVALSGIQSHVNLVLGQQKTISISGLVSNVAMHLFRIAFPMRIYLNTIHPMENIMKDTRTTFGSNVFQEVDQMQFSISR
jgi:hypothetical protein